MTNIGKRSFDSHGEKVYLHGCKITIFVQETNDGISHRKTFALKGNNAHFV